MAYGWTPPVEWTLTVPDGSGTRTVDLSPLALDWEVLFGCQFDAVAGRWVLISAQGHLTLDNSAARLDPTEAGAVIAAADLTIPRPISLTMAAETLWQGYAVVRGAKRLQGDAVVSWPLTGRFQQALLSQVRFRQIVDRDSPEFAARKIAFQMAGRSDASLLISPVSAWPDGLSFADVTVDETGGRAWDRLAHAMAAIPLEDRSGKLGMSAVHKLDDGRQTTWPDGIVPILADGDSAVETVGTRSLWAIDVRSKNYVRSAAATALVTTPDAGFTRSVAIDYPYPAGVTGVEWVAPQPTAAAGWTVVDWQAYPHPGAAPGDTVRAVLRKDVSSASPSGVRFLGHTLTQDATTPYIVNPVRPDIAGLDPALAQERLQETAPWIDHTDTAFDLDAHAKLVQQINETKVRATLVYPLWAIDEARRLPLNIAARTGWAVPATASRLPVSATEHLDVITETVRYRGGAGRVPTVTLTGLTASLAGTADDPVETLLPTLPPGIPHIEPQAPAVDPPVCVFLRWNGSLWEYADPIHGVLVQLSVTTQQASFWTGRLRMVEADNTSTAVPIPDYPAGTEWLLQWGSSKPVSAATADGDHQDITFAGSSLPAANLLRLCVSPVTLRTWYDTWTANRPDKSAGILYLIGQTWDRLYTLDATTGVATRVGAGAGFGAVSQFGVSEDDPRALASLGGVLFMLGIDHDALFTLDASTGVATRVAVFADVRARTVYDLTAHDGKLYVIASPPGSSNSALFTLDASTGVATRVGNARFFGLGFAQGGPLASHDGKLYMAEDWTEALYTLDTSTGVATRVGNATRFGVGEFRPSGLASHDGKLYMVGTRTDALFTLDASTGVATRVGTATAFDVNEQLPSGLASHPV